MEFNTYQLSKWRQKVLDRDKSTCQMCGRKPGRSRLNAHHIYPKSHPKYHHLAYEPTNGITLCAYDCHKERCHAGNTFNDKGWWKRWTKMFCFLSGSEWIDPQ